MTKKQLQLKLKHGTPSEFTKAVMNAVGLVISRSEAENAIEAYQHEWDEAGQTRKPSRKPVCKRCGMPCDALRTTSILYHDIGSHKPVKLCLACSEDLKAWLESLRNYVVTNAVSDKRINVTPFLTRPYRERKPVQGK